MQVSYTDDRGYGSEDDEEIERREKAAKQELVPAFMESQEGYDDEVERVLSNRCGPACLTHGAQCPAAGKPTPGKRPLTSKWRKRAAESACTGRRAEGAHH